MLKLNILKIPKESKFSTRISSILLLCIVSVIPKKQASLLNLIIFILGLIKYILPFLGGSRRGLKYLG
jgi:hypothetical protein